MNACTRLLGPDGGLTSCRSVERNPGGDGLFVAMAQRTSRQVLDRDGEELLGAVLQQGSGGCRRGTMGPGVCTTTHAPTMPSILGARRQSRPPNLDVSRYRTEHRARITGGREPPRSSTVNESMPVSTDREFDAAREVVIGVGVPAWASATALALELGVGFGEEAYELDVVINVATRRADIVAAALSSATVRWQLAAGAAIAAEQDEDVAGFEDLRRLGATHALSFVSVESGSVKAVLSRVGKAPQTPLIAAMLAFTGISGYSARNVIDAFRVDGAKCEFEYKSELSDEARKFLRGQIARMPENCTIKIELRPATGANVRLRMPERKSLTPAERAASIRALEQMLDALRRGRAESAEVEDPKA